MKSIKEKAEAYDSIIEKANKMHSENCVDCKACIEELIPELAESEDEKIRKALIRLFTANNTEKFGEFTNKQFITWLEKQGKKPADTVEPKFHEGEWITNGDYIWKILEVRPLDYTLLSQHDNIVVDTISHVDEQFHSFTIQDAKDGDVLWHSDTASHGTFIFKQIRYDGKVLCYCDYDSEDHFCTGEHHTCCWSSDKCIKPATNEQRELLFQKMHEAGYEWDFKKKDLKKINSYCQENCKGFQETGKCFADGECKAKRETEQRPTQEIEPFEAEHGKYYYCIKDYFCGGRKQASKGDVIQALRGLPIMGLKDASEYFLPVNFIKCNSAWSEKDSYYRNHIIQIIEEINNAPLKRGEDWEAYINWLKSLKERIGGKV